MDSNPIVKAAKPVLILQAGILVVATIVFAIISGVAGLQSALFGGLAAYIPCLIMTWLVKRAARKEPKQFVAAFMFAELAKLVLAGLLVFLAIKIGAPSPVAMFVAFAAVLLCNWAAPLFARS